MTTTLVIQHFLGAIYRIREVTNVHKRWDPYVIQGSYVISTLEYAREPRGT